MPRFSMKGALPFAHLLGGPAGKRARAEDDQDDREPKSRKAKGADDDEPNDDDEPKGRKAKVSDDDEPNDDEPKGRKAKGSDDDEPDDDEPKSRKAKRAEDDDEDNEPKGRRTAAEDDDEEEEREAEEDERDPKARAARRRERARCAAIFGSKHAAGRVASAAHLAFNTKMTATAAIGVLQTMPQAEAAASGLGARMGAIGTPSMSGSAPPPPGGRQAVTSAWDAAAKRAGIRQK